MQKLELCRRKYCGRGVEIREKVAAFFQTTHTNKCQKMLKKNLIRKSILTLEKLQAVRQIRGLMIFNLTLEVTFSIPMMPLRELILSKMEQMLLRAIKAENLTI